MSEGMRFGKYMNQTPAQIALRDYQYFINIYRTLTNSSVKREFDYVLKVVNKFESKKECELDNCHKLAEFIAVWKNGAKTLVVPQVYCSEKCYNSDGIYKPETILLPLGLDAVLLVNEAHKQELTDIIAECMGIEKGKRSRQYLNEALKRCKLR